MTTLSMCLDLSDKESTIAKPHKIAVVYVCEKIFMLPIKTYKILQQLFIKFELLILVLSCSYML